MKALIFHGPFDMRLEDINLPKAATKEILVKVAAVGICGSDVHGFAGKTGRRSPGMIMGHEISGTISSLGNSTGKWHEGQKVVIQPIIPCGKCELCLVKKMSICTDKQFIGVNMDRCGGLAEYIAVPENNILPIPKDLPHILSCLTEPLAVGVSAASRINMKTEKTVLIVGAGMIGLSVLLVLRNRGMSKIFVVDQNEKKLDMAKRLGAHTINFLKQDPLKIIYKETDKKGVDVSIEAVGISESVQTSVFGVKNGGRIFLIGNSQKVIKLDMQDIVCKGKSIEGIYCYSQDDFQNAIAFIDQNRNIVSEFVEKEVTPELAPKLFAELAKNEIELLRAVVLFDKHA